MPESEAVGPHVVIVTVPCPGHIIPAMQLAKFLLSRGMKVSCFSTGINYASVERNLREEFNHEAIRFRPLIDPAEFVSPGKELTANISWMQRRSDGEMAGRFEAVVRALTPPPACIVTDLMVGWAQDVADRARIPRHVLYTMPANALLFSFACVPHLLSPRVAPLHPLGTWNSMIDTTHSFYDYMMRNAKRLQEADIILVNSFEALEEGFLRLMRSDLIGKPSVQIQRILSIGPLIRTSDRELGVAHTAKSREDTSCAEVFEWLDAREPSSVVYVSFGSLLTVTETQLHELAHGLALAERPFLWVYRAPNAPQVLPSETEDASCFDGLPAGFLERVEGRGKLIHGWAPQEKILAHEAVGAFMSHCGWNSSLEALWAGKPLIAWPLAVEQRLTARYFANDMRIAVEIRKDDDGMVESAEVVRAISVLMEDEEIRSRFVKMHHLAHLALKEGGTSRANLNLLVDSIERQSQRCQDGAA